MKTLNECKDFYIDCLFSFYAWEDRETEKEVEMFKDVLRFIYGKKSTDYIISQWTPQALNEFYSKK